ncbi:MAG: DctP family TRAP transporter solute-binding subunit [Deltaproteobacteria bacterium]|nr:DctP family TRAP transporter solute-binding subunit [Deltaproteobacteria bacterium]
MKRLTLFVAAVCLCLLAAPGAEAAKKPIILKAAHNGNLQADDAQNMAFDVFKKMVEEKSNGEIKVQLYPAAQLGDARTIVEGVQMGTIELGDIENGPMGRFVPEAMLWDLPYIFRDIDHAHAVLDGPLGKEVQELYLKVGIRHLGYNDGGFRSFTNSKRPIKSIADMQGLKIRVMESEVMINTINAFGASAIPMAFGELYSALQQGVVDGQENPLNLIESQRFYEVQKYLSQTEHFYYPRQYILSEKFWQKLSPEHQKIVAEAALAGCATQRKRIAEQEAEMLGILGKLGMEITPAKDIDKESFAKAAREKIYPMFYAKIGGTEARGKELVQRVIDTK